MVYPVIPSYWCSAAKGSGKWDRFPDVSWEEIKKCWIGVATNGPLPLECKFSFLLQMAIFCLCPLFTTAALGWLYERLWNIEPDPSQYSDPRNMTTFPFPFIYSQLPADQFHFHQFHFAYMGWTAFSELWWTVHELKVGERYTWLYIQGTMGNGKSHIIAVFGGLLSHSGKWMVYLPDCREHLVNKLCYLQTALLCTFADPPSSDEHDKI